MAVVVAPAVGPTLGGWITDNFSWRWIFYINVPIVLISLFLSHRLVEDPPYLQKERDKSTGSRIDFVGLGLIVVAIGSLQLALDKGQELDWFSSPWITILIALAVYTLIFFIVWEWRHKDPVVDIRLFKRRNFATAMFFTFVLGIVLFGTTVVIPQFLQTLLGYPAVNAGEALAGGGIAMMIMMPVAGFLVGKMDPRVMMMGGFLATSASLVYIARHLSLGMDFHTAAMLRTYQAAGLAFIFLPSNTLAYVGIPREKNNQVSSMNAFVRNVGGSIGIALISSYVTRQGQRHQHYLTDHASPGNPAFDNMVSGLVSKLSAQGVADATRQAYLRVAGMIQAQALTLAYVDMMMTLAIVVACLAPLVFIMKRPKPGQAPPPDAH